MRRQIDEAVTQALGLDPEWVATTRRELAREPSVTDRGHGYHLEIASSSAEAEETEADDG